MKQETEHEKYTRLAAVITSTYEAHELTEDEKREIGDVLAHNMTPYEFNCDVWAIDDIWYGIGECYRSLNDLELTKEYTEIDDCKTVEDWIEKNGLPLPDADGMFQAIIDGIDEEEYIDDNYEDILDMLPEQCEFNLSDDEIVHLFEVYVDEPDEDEEEVE